MKKTTTFEDIGWGKFAKSRIIIEEFYTPSNDFDCVHAAAITEDFKLFEATTDNLYEALMVATDEETAKWLIKKM